MVIKKCSILIIIEEMVVYYHMDMQVKTLMLLVNKFYKKLLMLINKHQEDNVQMIIIKESMIQFKKIFSEMKLKLHQVF